MNDYHGQHDIFPITRRRADPGAFDPPQTDVLPPGSEATVALAMIDEVRRLAEEVGRLRERLAVVEARAVAAETASEIAEQRRQTEKMLADTFVDLLDSRLRDARRKLREFDAWAASRPPRP